jgi:hypothetical protein
MSRSGVVEENTQQRVDTKAKVKTKEEAAYIGPEYEWVMR